MVVNIVIVDSMSMYSKAERRLSEGNELLRGGCNFDYKVAVHSLVFLIIFSTVNPVVHLLV